MTKDNEILREVIEDSSPLPTLLKVAGAIVGGIVINAFEVFPVDWLMPLLCVFAYLASISVAFMRASSEEKSYNVAEANSKATQAIAFMKKAKAGSDRAIATANELKTETNELREFNERLTSEVQTLRANERLLQGKITNARQELANAKQELASVDEAMTNASKAMSERISKAVANATKPLNERIKALSPYEAYFDLKRSYDSYRGIINSPNSSDTEKEGAKRLLKEVKAQMSAFEEQLKQ